MNPILQRRLVFAIISVLFSVCVLLGMQLYISSTELKIKTMTLMDYQTNERILGFTELFIEKVLKSKGEVSFEDRLKLENAVREIGDENILNQWQKFTDSQNNDQAQEECKTLIAMLVGRIQY